MIVPSKRNEVYFSRYERVDVYNDQLIVETPSELTFSTKMFGNVANALKNVGKSL